MNYRPKLLLHVCCAPCLAGSYFQIADQYDVTLFWFNPNIMPKEERDKRLNELIWFAEILKVPLVLSDKEIDFPTLIAGLENEPEGGRRCTECFNFRLKETANYAEKNNFDFFATTLTVSPYKNTPLINEIGRNIETKSVKYLESDFKKNNGYQKSIELCKEYGIYRQKYCGCKYSIQ